MDEESAPLTGGEAGPDPDHVRGGQAGGSFFSLLMLGVYFGLWLTYKNDKCDKPIATWFLGMALMGLATVFVSLFVGNMMMNSPNAQGFLIQFFMSGYTIFAVGWFIAGNVWVWGSKSCESGLLLWGETLLIITYVIAGLVCCCLCCLLGMRGSSSYERVD